MSLWRTWVLRLLARPLAIGPESRHVGITVGGERVEDDLSQRAPFVLGDHSDGEPQIGWDVAQAIIDFFVRSGGGGGQHGALPFVAHVDAIRVGTQLSDFCVSIARYFFTRESHCAIGLAARGFAPVAQRSSGPHEPF